MRAAAVQLNSNEDKDRNLARADRLTRAAAADGADLVVLPEKFNVLGSHDAYRANAEALDGPTVGWAREPARELRHRPRGGLVRRAREGHDKLGNTSVHVGPDGEMRGVYRKIHMFDVTVEGKEYRESASQEAGDEIVTSEAEGARLGLTVCYDLRFPELYRILAMRGARILTIPAAFTKVTGRRTGTPSCAPGRSRTRRSWWPPTRSAPTRPTTRASAARRSSTPGARCSRARPTRSASWPPTSTSRARTRCASRCPSLANRVPSAYRWPEEARV